jgi:transposase-like protein
MSTNNGDATPKRKSPITRAVLRAAVAGAGPRLPAPVSMPHNAPSCPDLPRQSSNLQNEPTATHAPLAGEPAPPRPGQCSQRNIKNEPIKRPGIPHSASNCPANTANMQNEPTATAHEEGQLTPRQLTAISALFAGHSFTETARYLRIDRKTLFRWRNSAPFIAEVRRRYAEQTTRRVRPGVEPPWMKEVRLTREGGLSNGG